MIAGCANDSDFVITLSEYTSPVFERRYQYTSEGRISTAPPKRAARTRVATSMARVEVVSLEDEPAADALLDPDERAVCRHGLAAFDPHGGRVLGQAIGSPGVTPGV